jgi:hypothetical protein|uniref:Uncharacterized protein n=1 Tax=viral metagenome TaxID=1070528 RepID=A0A6C0BLY3_9ZZZZ
MLTKCLHDSQLKTHNGHPFSINGVDPGWVSVDEYYENDRPYIVPPLDKIDGAARILYPVFANLRGLMETSSPLRYVSLLMKNHNIHPDNVTVHTIIIPYSAFFRKKISLPFKPPHYREQPINVFASDPTDPQF